MGFEAQTLALTRGEQRALAAFIAGRMPAGKLQDELVRQRAAAVEAAAGREAAEAAAADLAPAALPAFGAA